MFVRDIMTKSVIGVQADAAIEQAIDVMLGSHVSGLLVFDGNKKLVGILSEGDLLRRTELATERHRPRWIEFLRGPGRLAGDYVHTHGRKVEEVMTGDVVTTTGAASLGEAIDLMNRHNVKRLPVMRDGLVVGIVTRADLVRALAKLLPADDRKLKDNELRETIMDQLNQQKWVPTASINVDVVDGVVEFRGGITDDRQREALHVLAENIPGVRAIRDRLVWIDPYSGVFVLSPEDEEAANTAVKAAASQSVKSQGTSNIQGSDRSSGR